MYDRSANPNVKAMVDIYNHILETLINSLPSVSTQTLHIIFNEVILPNIFTPELTPELRSYLFRITERIIAICEGDLTVGVSFIANLLNSIENPSPSIKNSGQKLWETTKLKIIYNMENKLLNKFIDWIAESLLVLAENDNLST